ncbi:MAG TPA: hypothetical protein PL025_07330, partial [Anaerolineaceae bacterium]|nr:hypothetical protein [Anaerolineaceae bacterium]
MKKTILTLGIVTLILGIAIFGAVSAVSAKRADKSSALSAIADKLAEPMVYRRGWGGAGGSNGTCDGSGTCD